MISTRIKMLTFYSKKMNFFKTYNNCKFSSKLLFSFGLNLGGHLKSLQLSTSSIIFGIRTENSIINSNLTAIELIKISQIIENLGYYRAIVYFINSILSIRISFFKRYRRYNKHLFFPLRSKIKNLLKKFRLLRKRKYGHQKQKHYSLFHRRQLYLLRSGKNLLRKLFFVSKWTYGFVSNYKGFFVFVKNTMKKRVKIGKSLTKVLFELHTTLDWFPLFPNYAFIGDHRQNYWIVNEFTKNCIPNSSIIDNFTSKALFSMYGIPGNACSIDSNLFFLMLMISNYLLGFYKHILRFTINYQISKSIKKEMYKKKKQYNFKTYQKYLIIL